MKLDAKTAKRFAELSKKEGIFDLAEKLVKKFPKAEVYLVGGAVRDIILGRPVKDIDVMARRVKIADLEKFLGKLGRVNLVGKRFSVLKFIPKAGGLSRFARNDKKEIDISIPRKDFAFGTGGYKDFKVKSNPDLPVEEDLGRRDFTVNAMAWNILSADLTDPFGGMADLKKKVLRAVGEPARRFAEDYSRMLRAIRFAMQLDFKIETKTWAAVKKYIRHINDSVKGERKVPYEVIAAEFLKSFDAKPRETVEFYISSGAAKELMPEIMAMKKCTQPKEFHSEGDVLIHTLIALDNTKSDFFKKYFPEPVSLTTKVAILLHDIGKPKSKKKIDGRTVFYNHDKIGADAARAFLDRMKFSAPPDVGVDSEQIIWLIENHLLFFYSPPEQMKKTTLEKYLFNKRFSGLAHMQLFLADATATKPERVKLDLTRFKKSYELWRSFQKTEKAVMPKPILNGNEIMKILGIKPSPEVGRILGLLREEQLNGRVKIKAEAEKFLKKMKNPA
jgi:poly(A) polymerase